VTENKVDTFCVITLYMVSCAQLTLIVSLANYLFTIYFSWHIYNTPEQFEKVFIYGFALLQIIREYFIYHLFFMLFIEWWLMLFLINFEKKYTVSEIVYIQNNDDKFIKKENHLKIKILVFYIVMSIFTLAAILLGWIDNLP